MNHQEGLGVLASLYDRGLLVPFIGSGMSMGPCASWSDMIASLERVASTCPAVSAGDLVVRAEAVMDVLRRRAHDVSAWIREAVYVPGNRGAPSHSEALARMRWPLICTTNYDDVYLRAALQHAVAARRQSVPRVRGRSEHDCRSVLQHLALPAGEMLWALQGFLTPEEFAVRIGKGKEHELQMHDCLEVGVDLSSEIVLGHGEYRKVTHRMPHFRRCFSEVFRSRSFLFLGSGLTETYFRTLFDEVIELLGPPLRPHFALVEKGKLDWQFMRSHYHIVCIEYEQRNGEPRHSQVGQFLNNLADKVSAKRVHVQAWGWNVPSTTTPSPSDADKGSASDFTIVRARVPLRPDALDSSEIVGISCGRQVRTRGPNKPIAGSRTKEVLAAELARPVCWINDHLVQWEGSEDWLRGIVAREPGSKRSRAARSPKAVRTAFEQFLADARSSRKEVAYVQLLSAGKLKTFQSWMSLVQMARAYGRWSSTTGQSGGARLRVVVHVQDEDVIGLLNGGYLDIAEHLADAPLRMFVEIIHADGQAQREHIMVDAESRLGDLPTLRGPKMTNPSIRALPMPGKDAHPAPFATVADVTLADFGLVSGSTVVVDYRPLSIKAACDAKRQRT